MSGCEFEANIKQTKQCPRLCRLLLPGKECLQENIAPPRPNRQGDLAMPQNQVGCSTRLQLSQYLRFITWRRRGVLFQNIKEYFVNFDDLHVYRSDVFRNKFPVINNKIQSDFRFQPKINEIFKEKTAFPRAHFAACVKN